MDMVGFRPSMPTRRMSRPVPFHLRAISRLQVQLKAALFARVSNAWGHKLPAMWRWLGLGPRSAARKGRATMIASKPDPEEIMLRRSHTSRATASSVSCSAALHAWGLRRRRILLEYHTEAEQASAVRGPPRAPESGLRAALMRKQPADSETLPHPPRN